MNEPETERSKYDADTTNNSLIVDDLPTNSSNQATGGDKRDLKFQKVKLEENQYKEVGNKSK